MRLQTWVTDGWAYPDIVYAHQRESGDIAGAYGFTKKGHSALILIRETNATRDKKRPSSSHAQGAEGEIKKVKHQDSFGMTLV
jgi:hypothetical protein